MSEWDDLIASLTHRLRVDPELQMEVSRELRGHLEDSAAEFRAAGQDLQQAAASAAKALGDQRELAEQLWQANRGRIRVRGVVRWAARVALVPGAIAVIVILAGGLAGLRWPGTLGSPGQVPASWLAKLTEEQRLLLQGNPDQEATAKALVDRRPDDPVYYGNYVSCLLRTRFLNRGRKVTEAQLAEILAVLDRGERIDPDNAFYNFEKAVWLVRTSSTAGEDAASSYQVTDARGKIRRRNYWQIEIRDPDRFARGLTEFRRGVAKSEFTHHVLNMLDRRLALLPEPRRFSDYTRQLYMQLVVCFPPAANRRNLGRSLLAYAVDLAKAERAEEAVALVESVDQMAVKAGATCRTLIGLLVAQAMRVEALSYAERVYDELGRPEQVGEARRARDDQVAAFKKVWEGPRMSSLYLRHAGMMTGALVPGIPGYQIDFEPTRTAERFVAAEMGLLLLLVLIVLLTLLLGAMTVLGLAIRRGANRPVLLFAGWGRIAKVYLLAIVLPVGLLVVYARVLTAGDRVYGLNYTAGKTLLEFVLISGAVCALLLGLSYSAIRRRGEEIGLTVPPQLRLRDRPIIATLGALIVVAAVVYLAGWAIGPFKPDATWRAWHWKTFGWGFGALIAAAVVALLGLWALRELLGLHIRKGYDRFRRSLSRSLVPILATAVIGVGALGGWTLSRGERAAVRRIKGSAAFDFRNEIQGSNFRLLRDRFANLHKATMPTGNESR